MHKIYELLQRPNSSIPTKDFMTLTEYLHETSDEFLVDVFRMCSVLLARRIEGVGQFEITGEEGRQTAIRIFDTAKQSLETRGPITEEDMKIAKWMLPKYG